MGAFSLAKDNRPVPGCTVSGEILPDILCFSLAEHTDISAEIFPYHKFLYVLEGCVEVYGPEMETKTVHAEEGIVAPIDTAVGVRTETSAVYVEIAIGRNEKMNDAIKAGEVFSLAGLVPYQDGKIVNMDIVSNEKMKFVVMAFDEGTGLSEHAAPGEAIVFALDGEGVIGYEGADHPIKAGEQFHFAKGGLHSVKANGRFKMALLLTLE